ncbi:3-phosphoserine/phosphohydroxythreonine transaminase [Cytobacillus spongiae]|uniref:3-phosphoserine/phosphohydroxythreonine transaminase n=1 Tax=Cytobacillus spongiae TaxID=2901381 RepID=UPI001F35B27D|nr:3-phosphoserine/phosphohydroxythreonine transaminase [Cytobacillus spongiae]UII56887.1 3-phosphoserine/phosphohydroxythreonine transaminase [Cytobacillus spongiae]
MRRTFNFNAGPAALPQPVLEKASKNWLNFDGTGMGIMELSHRSKEYELVHEGAKARLRRLLAISDDYEILFLQGGASLQFSMVPMNLLGEDEVGCYILTGAWSEKALKEAEKIGRTSILSSGKALGYQTIPHIEQPNLPSDAAYVHLTSNNTIYGTQWSSYPSDISVPLIADMSSDILSKPIDVNKFGLIYAGAQKNLGPSGVTVVMIHKQLLEKAPSSLPTMLNYQTHANSQSLYNTPPTLSIYLLYLVLEWVEEIGGVDVMAKHNQQKANILYSVIDESSGFFNGHATVESRSLMNVTFTLPSEEYTKQFLQEAKSRGFVGLSGHRSIGGCRASIYNAVPQDDVVQLAQFMKEFQLQYS